MQGCVADWAFSENGAPYLDRIAGHALELAGDSAPVRHADGFAPGVASLGFDGTDQHLAIAATAVGDLQMGGQSDQVTVAAWVKRRGDTNAAIAGIWPEDAADPQRQYALFVNLDLYGGDDRVCGHVSRIGAPEAPYHYVRDYSWNARRIAPEGDGWRLAVMTYDGAQVRSYLDGCFEPVASYTDVQGVTGPANPYPFAAGLNPTPAEFTVGAVRLTGGYGNFLHGDLARLRVWRRALSATEVRQVYLSERPAAQPLFHQSFRTTGKAAPSALGWHSFQGAQCHDVSDITPGQTAPDVYHFAGAAAGSGGYLARTGLAQGSGAAFYAGLATAPLPLMPGAVMSWSMNNASISDGVRTLIKVNGAWFASAASFACQTSHSATDWTTAERFSHPLGRTPALWRAVTLAPGNALALGPPPSAPLSGNWLEAFGFFMDTTATAPVRIDDLSIVCP